ncbi:CDP-alcohol phosphatidyltransferase family protein [Frigidibacter sp. ROC022]|uniref:CDP-alcohol phosphatidyltransferase family protein n=1 Tax=Frigidibacter sp. ROC022 TaxID=2971796 RepID=UPI00215A20C2|nr:CDP-alcohol phosphatidyltransferase family protein [Frigidibacter sp. ROC022]MCR8723811.1 CDP-alcohol phosphatidyltransferase family protein [Frigidibacter sp. ROC022]
MIDRYLLPTVKVVLTPVARVLVARGVHPDHVTVAGFGLGILAVPALAMGWTVLALVLIAANRIADGLDGTMARMTRPSDRGAFLDIALDFFFYALVPLGFALCEPARNALPAAVLIAAFMGTGSSFLAFAVLAERRGLKTEDYPAKGFYYLGGLTEGTETIALFVAMCLIPGSFPWLAYGFAAACLLTSITRWRMGWEAFGKARDNDG